MSATILDGKATRDQILKDLSVRIGKLKSKPTLAIVLVGDSPASTIYVREKEKAARKIGAGFRLIKKSSKVGQEELETAIRKLNTDPKVSGIVVQKPLPGQIAADEIDLLVRPEKDVDGLNPVSPFVPATARGIIELLTRSEIEIAGKDVVVVGRSKLVGLPTALEFINHGATVTICHSKTRNLAAKTQQADILVVAIGKPRLIKKDMVKSGAVVVDVGINREDQTRKLVGDVDFENVKNVASKITPVPGGVGPMTVAALMMNLTEAVSKK